MKNRHYVTECRGVYLSAPFVSLCAVHDSCESISGWLWSYALSREILPGIGELRSRRGRKSKSKSRSGSGRGRKSEGKSESKYGRKRKSTFKRR